MLTVGKDSAGVEGLLSAGRLGCPGCGGRLRGWGHARSRVVRGEDGIGWRLRPRRARCAGCRRTHVLLPVSVLARRADVVSVIGAALAGAAAGLGHRPIAELLGRPAALLCALDPDPQLPEPAGSQVADAVAAILAAAGAVARRWGRGALVLSAWELAAAVSGARLLAPGIAEVVINTNCPW